MPAPIALPGGAVRRQYRWCWWGEAAHARRPAIGGRLAVWAHARRVVKGGILADIHEEVSVVSNPQFVYPAWFPAAFLAKLCAPAGAALGACSVLVQPNAKDGAGLYQFRFEVAFSSEDVPSAVYIVVNLPAERFSTPGYEPWYDLVRGVTPVSAFGAQQAAG